jgi:spore coat protein U-like protein
MKRSHTPGLLFLAILFSVVGLIAPRSALAADVDCTATMSGMDFGNVDINNGTSATATLSYTCQNNTNQRRYVRVCFSIGDGAQGGGNFSPRRMLDGANDPLNFQLYQDPGHTIVWGSIYNSFPAAFVDLSLGKHGSSSNNPLTMYGVVLSGQPGAIPGNYQDQFSGYHTEIEVAETQNKNNRPQSCGSGNGQNFPFTVRANVAKLCTITATDMDFGTPAGFLSANIDTTSALQVRCTNTTAWKIGLDNGQHASGNIRRMQGPGGYFVNYELYQDSARTVRWGNTPGSDTENGSGSGAMQPLTVYGRVPPQSTPVAGSYNDTVTVTVTY